MNERIRRAKEVAFVVAVAVAFPPAVQAGPGDFSVEWSYENSHTGLPKSSVLRATLPSPDVEGGIRAASHPEVSKSQFLIRTGRAFEHALKGYEENCEKPQTGGRPNEDRTSFRGEPPVWPPREPRQSEACRERRAGVAPRLRSEMEKLATELRADVFAKDLRQYSELIDLGQKLARNIEVEAHRSPGVPNYPGYPEPETDMPQQEEPKQDFPKQEMPKGGDDLDVTAGGSKDFEFFRTLVKGGHVPRVANLWMEGLLSEFKLSFSAPKCEELLCMNPATLVDHSENKLYVQLSMKSGVTEKTFSRKPLNLSVVLDISGSMDANDDTHQSRLEWAKQAIRMTLDNLKPQDLVSIVIFDDKAETIVPTRPPKDIEAIWSVVKSLRTRGSTDVYSGLKLGFDQVASGLKLGSKYEHRVILITDANLNTGETRVGAVEAMTKHYADHGIGLTAIGLGYDFRDDLSRAISRLRGGNSLYVQSGTKLLDFFKRFDYLVTPVAYDFKASVTMGDSRYRLRRAYGIPTKEGETRTEVIDISTLFFAGSGSGGGALVLEYDFVR